MQAVLVHGWDGNPENAWFPWLKRELEKRNFEVKVPNMPDPPKPEIVKWIDKLATIGPVDKNTYFIGHSIGCQAILRYLEKYSKQIGGAVFVAGWFTLKNLESSEETIAGPWLETPIDFDKVGRASQSFTAIFSDNDPFVPLKNNAKMFREKLGADIIIEQGMGHFDDSAGIRELPSALKSILNMSSKKKS